MDSWFREIHVPRAGRVYLATGFDFRENRAGFGSILSRICVPSLTLSLYYEGTVKGTIFFSQIFVYVLRTTTACPFLVNFRP